jgi:hypothetical protein
VRFDADLKYEGNRGFERDIEFMKILGTTHEGCDTAYNLMLVTHCEDSAIKIETL